jgi:hypothetical protein
MALYCALLVAAAVSAFVGISNAGINSKDLQWAETRLFLNGTNPYRLFLNSDSGIPSYITRDNFYPMKLPSTILLFIPNSIFTFDTAKLVWILINITSTFLFSALSVRLFGSRQTPILNTRLFLLLLISSTAWRITIGIGQHGLVAMSLFMLALYFYRQNQIKTTILLSALAMIKYTLVLPFFALFWYRKKDAVLVTCSVLCIHAVLTVVAGLLVAEDPLALVLQSLKIALTNAGNGAFDFFCISISCRARSWPNNSHHCIRDDHCLHSRRLQRASWNP